LISAFYSVLAFRKNTFYGEVYTEKIPYNTWLAEDKMIYALEKHQFGRVQPLAQETILACAAAAVIDGTSPGQVWVDDAATPVAALVDTPEGHYLLGSPPDDDFPQALTDFIAGTISPGGRGKHWWWFYLRCGSGEWAEVMKKVLPTGRTAEEPREFYLCDDITVDWRVRIPAGFELVRVDRSLLQRDDVKNTDRIRRWAESNFGSVEAFLEKGFSFCVRRADDIVSWCCCDCVSAARCEVGIHTAEGFRRRGLATVAVAAAVEWALSNGFDSVGWHCHAFNVASAATALKSGFRKVTDYTAFKICAKAVDADVLNGTAALTQHRFQESADLYSKAFQAVASSDASVSYLLGSREERAKYSLMAACAFSLSGQPEAGTGLLDDAINLAGCRQGGY